MLYLETINYPWATTVKIRNIEALNVFHHWVHFPPLSSEEIYQS